MIRALLILIGVVTAFAGVQTYRVAICKTEVAELKSAYLVLTEKAAEQSAAVQRWEEAANARSKAGQIARAKAQAKVASGAAEVERLRALLAGSRGVEAKDCKDAVAEVRKGLK